MSSSPVSRNRLNSIQYVRALASIIVVGWHSGFSYTVLGQSGVDLFFVVSGFVMMLVSGRESSPALFGFARVLRIVPLYWLMTLIVAAVDRPSATELVSSLLFWPSRTFPVVIQGWSLNLEVLYYVLFALTLFAGATWRLPLLAAEMAALCLAVPILAGHDPVAMAYANPMALEFLAGACLFALWQRRWLLRGMAAWALGIAGLLALALTHRLGGAPEGWMRALLWGVPAVAMVAATLGVEQSDQLPRMPWLTALGNASYSIYLTHYLALRAVSGTLHTLWAPFALALAIVWGCVVGLLVYRAIEKPMHEATSGLIKRLGTRRAPA